jgi:hypothetical protein
MDLISRSRNWRLECEAYLLWRLGRQLSKCSSELRISGLAPVKKCLHSFNLESLNQNEFWIGASLEGPVQKRFSPTVSPTSENYPLV